MDNDIYFVLASTFAVIVNGRRVALRRVGQHLGEMAIVDPVVRRSATVIVSEASLVAQLSEAGVSLPIDILMLLRPIAEAQDSGSIRSTIVPGDPTVAN